MKSAVSALAAAVLALSGAAVQAGELKGTAEVTSSVGYLSNPYPDAHIESASVLFDLDKGYKVGGSITAVDAWGGHATYVALRALTPVNETMWFDSSIGASDRDKVTVRSRVGTMFNVKIPAKSTILGVGADWYDMRGGGQATTISGQAVYYVPTMPLVLQANVAYAHSHFGKHGGGRSSLTATYGRVGQWTVTGSVGTGRVHYELISQPGTIADYNSSNASVGVRYWMAPDWGISTNLGHVKNRYYERTELRAGVFVKF